MYRLIVILTMAFWLVACTSKEAQNLEQRYKSKLDYHKALQKTQKVQFYQDRSTQALFTATYLNTQKDKNQTERFILSVYQEDENLSYTLKLNGKSPLAIKTLLATDPKLKNLSFVTQWGSYYLLEFPYSPSPKLFLTIQTTAYGKKQMYFSKVAKYVLE